MEAQVTVIINTPSNPVVVVCQLNMRCSDVSRNNRHDRHSKHSRHGKYTHNIRAQQTRMLQRLI
ncbi:hypothetical protein E2C01_069932 [Portunus trituberculatus]|uniref:Uncharacterized protein n=1 Tax=Portunus trituberculatus TaxID=210409 RepID=A0A5B7HVV5_PORTR|nr:hypothetical protein [Portunus trituberculatus]